MKNTGMDIKHPKRRGEWAEMRFMARAAEHGLQVTKPWGETARYDFAVEHDARFVRVQVKSTMFRERDGYSCTVRGCRGPYESDPFDFVVAYLIPEDIWYIIPAEKFQRQGSIGLYPRLKSSKYGQYKEACHLLRGKRRSAEMVGRIEACAVQISSIMGEECIGPSLASVLLRRSEDCTQDDRGGERVYVTNESGAVPEKIHSCFHLALSGCVPAG